MAYLYILILAFSLPIANNVGAPNPHSQEGIHCSEQQNFTPADLDGNEQNSQIDCCESCGHHHQNLTPASYTQRIVGTITLSLNNPSNEGYFSHPYSPLPKPPKA